MIGRRVGRLIVEAEAPARIEPSGRRKLMWQCRCDCGEVVTVEGSNLRYCGVKSCGCWRREVSGQQFTIHGHTKGGRTSPEHVAWQNMRNRCYDSSNKSFDGYGGRGITVCDRWNPSNGGSFENFLSDMGKRPGKGFSVDRIDNDNSYGPDNCRWADRKTQARNTRRNVFVNYKGQKMTKAEAMEVSGVAKYTVDARIKRGWAEDRWFEPVKTRDQVASS
jgi:hypothetical protein